MSHRLDDNALADLTKQYLYVWHVADPHIRRVRITDLGAAGGTQILTDMPEQIREACRWPGRSGPRLCKPEAMTRSTQASPTPTQPAPATVVRHE
jgi:hypothetical protein